MKHLIIACLLMASAPIAHAADEPDAPEELNEYLRNWMEDLAPLLDNLKHRLDDLSQYEAPEILPNGDIIIRRKQSSEDEEPIQL